MSTARTLAKNTTVLFIANIISYLLGFFTTIYTARYLGVEGFGVLSLALSLTGIFGVFIDLGLGTLTTREVSRNKSLASKYIGNISVMRIFLAFLTFGLISLTVYILQYPEAVKNVVYLISISVILTAFYGIFNSIFQAFEKMEYMSLNIILNAVLMIVGVLLVIYYGMGLTALASVYCFSSLMVLIVSFSIFSWKFFLPKLQIDFNFWKPTIKEALFFGVSSIFLVIYFYIDSVMLSVMVGNSAVGIYNAAYKLISVLLFIPSVFMASIFPVMSQHFESAKDILKLEYEKSIKYLFIIAMFIFICGFVFADKIILIIYGTKFVTSIITLQILILVVPIIFLTNLFGTILGAINKQRIFTTVAITNALFNITLNLILIPKFSYLGTSAATVATEGLGFILMFTYLSKYFFKISVTQNILKTIFVSILVLIIVYYIKISINWIIAAILGAFIYIILLYILKIITKEDTKIFKEIL